jgi:sulfoxide reductase catalytic subunit YedY
MTLPSRPPPGQIPSSEITPPHLHFNRRNFLKASAIAATAAATGLIYRKLNYLPPPAPQEAPLEGLATTAPSTNPANPVDPAIAKAYKLDEPQTPYQSITNYNNFYEFSTDKDGVAQTVGNLSTANWKITVDGLAHKPATFDLDDLKKISPPEERVYRMRCVEAWSMVIPWAGFSLSKLLAKVDPKSSAKFVAFTTILDPDHMPGQKSSILQWPYVEGLRIDEAMHPLTLLTTGLYGRKLPVQDGAPVRLIIPWKYGFKGIKSIVKISLTDSMPPTSWNRYAPHEYGFYANVNPNHDHPRWSQATEQRIGESSRRKTLMFNGYAEQVASLYNGMDLDRYF